MNKVEKLKQWQKDVLVPWQNAAQQYHDKQAQQVARLKRHAPELKTMVALIMDGKTQAAADIWNGLDFEPALREITLHKDELSLVLLDGKVQKVMLDDVLQDLSRLVA